MSQTQQPTSLDSQIIARFNAAAKHKDIYDLGLGRYGIESVETTKTTTSETIQAHLVYCGIESREFAVTIIGYLRNLRAEQKKHKNVEPNPQEDAASEATAKAANNRETEATTITYRVVTIDPICPMPTLPSYLPETSERIEPANGTNLPHTPGTRAADTE